MDCSCAITKGRSRPEENDTFKGFASGFARFHYQHIHIKRQPVYSLPEYSLERCQKNSSPRYAELSPNSCCTARPRDLESGCALFEVKVGMPHYEFFCHACRKTFSKILALVDYEEGEMRCPHCGSTHVEQRWSTFTAITSKKSA